MIAEARWIAPSRAIRHSESTSQLLRKAAPADEVAALFDELTAIRGAHKVEIKRNHGSVVDRKYVESEWFTLYFRGTARAVLGAKNKIAFSGLQEEDRNADHDHARCIEAARKMGVPAAYAHTPETYLSS